MEQYIKCMEQQLEQIQSNSSNIIIDKENTHPKSNDPSIQVNNLLVNNHTKGRPTKHARIKSAVEVLKENGQNKRARKKCQNCKEIFGHNSRSYPHPCGNCSDNSHKIHQCTRLISS
ncbi:hypothetical protein RclHR1_05770001 [Rhizophagus clarus]|uniref:Uncharacterized protein n=1 Tax=Rhizophagus clarus TaxID=94130 RepID=A0A2Z6RUS9_9GLOM|nr:hypothetical protein RclHR1_05770001 [Rhizophagus clarus]GES80650.1 hypothetical protein RCL_jg10964.t1 [Rhizophagus clarus]